MKIVVTHANADLDAIASTMAAVRLYEGAVAVGGSAVSRPVHRFLALHKNHFQMVPTAEIAEDEPIEEAIVVDVRDARRLKEYENLLARASRIVVFDHHPPTKHDLKADEVYVEPVGACVTLLLERLLEQGFDITPDEATLFMLGLYADTGRLSYASTRPRDVRMAAELLERGAQLKIVNRYLTQEFSPEQNDLLVALMSNVEEISIDHVEIALATSREEGKVRGASSAVQEIMEIGGHDAIFGIIEFASNDRVLIIGRSRVSYVDVGKVLRELGGGGHTGAGSANLKGCTLQQAREKLLAVLEEMPLEPERVEDIMTSPVHFLEHDTSLQEAQALLEEWNVTGAPVRRDQEVIGVISSRDIARARRGGRLELPVSSHMAHDIKCIDAQEPIEDALEMMTREDVGRLPVMREGEVVGIVTRTDLIRRLYMKQRDDSDL